MNKKKASKAFGFILKDTSMPCGIIKEILKQIIIFLLILLTFSLSWGARNFGNIGLNEIIFTLNMPLKEASQDFVADYFHRAFFPSLGIWAVELLFALYPFKIRYYFRISLKGKRDFKWRILPLAAPLPIFLLVFCVWISGLVFAADRQFGVFSYVKSQMANSTFIEEEYVNPTDVQIRFPEKKNNLICIYVESLESSMQDKENGGIFDINYIPELTQIAKDNVSFSQSDLIEGAAVAPASGWTIAGLVAETAGLPLKLFEYNGGKGGADNVMRKYQYFLPGAVTLGEILEKEGYSNSIMFGSKGKFGGRSTYFEQHGNYEVWDYFSAIEEGKIDEDYYENWGFEDEKLYAFAKEKLLELAEKNQPFHFSMLTADAHTPNGYLCSQCPSIYEQQYANVLVCESRQLSAFVEWISQQSFYQDTTIVICGDHCSMVKNFFGEYAYDKHNGEVTRKVYNAFIQPLAKPQQEKNRLFTTMDIFPTVVAALGGEIEGNRLGLGTNLFSKEETLAEKYGYEYLFEELNKKSRFYDKTILYP